MKATIPNAAIMILVFTASGRKGNENGKTKQLTAKVKSKTLITFHITLSIQDTVHKLVYQ